MPQKNLAKRTKWTLSGLVISALASQVLAVAGSVESVSNLARPSVSAGMGSYDPRFSGDGRFITFVSYARNLTTNETKTPYLNVYLKEVATGKISVVSAGAGLNASADGSSSVPTISSSGQFVVFESAASNLVAGDTNGFRDIFLRDTVAGTNMLITAPSGSGGANGDSYSAVISADGRWVLFESSASNLVTSDTNGISDVFLYDRLGGTTRLVSVGAQGLPGTTHRSASRSDSASLSANGKRVVFASSATNLVPGITTTLGEIYVRDLDSGITLWASSNLPTFGSSVVQSYNPVISGDGRLVVFKTKLSGSINPMLILHDLESGTNRVLSMESNPYSWPVLADNGNWVASESEFRVAVWSLAGGTNDPYVVAASAVGVPLALSPAVDRVAFTSASSSLVTNNVSVGDHLFLHDIPSHVTRLASVNLKRGDSSHLTGVSPSFDPTGDVLAFDSPQGDLVTGDENVASDVFLYQWQTDAVELVSARATAAPNTASHGPNLASGSSISANGRYVAFATGDTNVYASGKSNNYNFVVWDTWQRTNVVLNILTNVPVPDGGTSVGGTNYIPTGSGPDGPVLSLDGKVLINISATIQSSLLNIFSNVFAVNLESGSQTWVNRSPNAMSFNIGQSAGASISADNRFIAYQSSLSDIATDVPDGNVLYDVFVYDSFLHTNVTVSVAQAGGHTGDGNSINPRVSANGRWVVFQSTATDLTTNTSYPSGGSQIFARDLVNSNTVLLSFDGAGAPLVGAAKSHVISLNSQVAAFSGSYSSNGGVFAPLIMVYDFAHGTNAMVCTKCQNPSLDATGRWVVYEALNADLTPGDVIAKDLLTGETNLLSINMTSTGGGNGPSTGPLISSDARYVVFVSKASNLVPNDSNGAGDVFVRDRVLNTTTLLSINQQGNGPGNGASGHVALSADGRSVVFQSLASDLSAGDYSGFRDVFIVRLGGLDSDHDQMDDDWELAYFGSLSRDGHGDFDGDGVSDLDEFRGGTDPTNVGSVLRVITVSPLGAGPVTVLWASAPGRSYRVQFKDDLNADSWTEIPQTVVASSTTSSIQDTSAPTSRIYRVTLVQ